MQQPSHPWEQCLQPGKGNGFTPWPSTVNACVLRTDLAVYVGCWGEETEIIFCKVRDLLDEGEWVLACTLCKTGELSSATEMRVLENKAGE